MDICGSLGVFPHVYIDLEPRQVILQDILPLPTGILFLHISFLLFSVLRRTISSIGVHPKCVSTCRLFLPLALLYLPTVLPLQGLDFVQLLRILQLSFLTPNMLPYAILSLLFDFSTVLCLPFIYLLCQIPIDHNDSSVGTYQNRYWINDKHYSPGGPIFVYDTGETGAPQVLEINFANSSSWFEQMLEEFHGMGILWEHRYVEYICQINYLSWILQLTKI